MTRSLLSKVNFAIQTVLLSSILASVIVLGGFYVLYGIVLVFGVEHSRLANVLGLIYFLLGGCATVLYVEHLSRRVRARLETWDIHPATPGDVVRMVLLRQDAPTTKKEPQQ